MFQGSFQWISRVFEINSKGVSEKFQMCFKGDLRKFQECSKKVFSVLQGRLKGVSMEF